MSWNRDMHETAPCPKCGARAGQACQTVTGNRATYVHSARWAITGDAHSYGYLEGEYYTAKETLQALAEGGDAVTRLLARYTRVVKAGEPQW